MKKILICGVSSQNIYTFRRRLIEDLKARGHSVYTTAFDTEYSQTLKDLEIDFYPIKNNNRSLNFLKILSLKRKYIALLKQIKPDLVFTFALKPNIFGVIAAHKAGIENIYSMVEGAGDVFIKNGLKWKIVRRIVCHLYKKSFKFSKKVFFLNNDDKAEFIERELVKEEQCEVIHGIGVDLERFAYKPLKNNKTFLMIARMLKSKGVFEYCECARIVKQKYPDAVFNYLGAEVELKQSDIKSYIDDGSINYLGTTSDVRPYIEECFINVLPSYREGFGLVNAESAAMGRPSITCDTNGTRDTVIDGYNGFLIEKKDVKAMVEKCIYAIEHFDEMVIMGQNARKFAEENFDCNKINEKIVKSIGLI